MFQNFFLIQSLDDAVQLLYDVFPFQNNVLAADELTKQKNYQIGVYITLAELPKNIQHIVVAKGDLVGFFVII